MHTTAQKKILANLLPVGLLVRTNLFIPSRFRTTYTNFDNCCLRYVTCGKIIYTCCTSTFSALNYCGGIFFKSISYLYEVVRTSFSAEFWTCLTILGEFFKFHVMGSQVTELLLRNYASVN